MRLIKTREENSNMDIYIYQETDNLSGNNDQKKKIKIGVVAHTYKPRTQKVEGRSGVHGRLQLCIYFILCV